MNKRPSTFAISCIATLVCFSGVHADDWPQWRGPNRDGVWRESGIVEKIPEGGLKTRWRARVGNGYSGPSVAAGRVFVTDHVLDPEVERVLCFDEATGKQLWVHSYPCPYEDMEYGNGPRASPTVHDGKVYTLGTKGHLFCLDAAKGTVVWSKEFVKDLKGRVPRYGVSAAPLVVGDLLIVCPGSEANGCVVALDRNTGKERWWAVKDRPAYSAPILVNAAGTQQLVVWTADSINALEPATGKVLWEVPRKMSFDEAEVVASPVLHKDQLLFFAAWSRSSLMLKLDQAKPGAAVVWKTRQKPSTMISTPLFADEGHFYAVLLDGSLACIDATSGEEVWNTFAPTTKKMGTAHLTPNGDRVFLFNESGHLILARFTPKGYEELGRTLLVEPTAGYRPQGALCWAHPAYANKSVYARNDRELVCVYLGADQAAGEIEKKQVVPSRNLGDFTGRNTAMGVAVSADGKTFAAGTWGSEVKLLDLASGKDLPAPARHKDWVCAVAFARDGKFVASAGGNEFKPARNEGKTTGQVKLWDPSAKAERSLDGHTSKVFAVTFSPDSKTLATASADGTARTWDVTNATATHVLRGHKGAVWSVAFAPDGQTIATASADRTVKLWDAASGKERATLPAHDEEVLAVAISPDGKTLATGSADWTIRLWDLATEKPLGELKGHQGRVLCLAFAADSKLLASGSGDETVRLWNPGARKELATLRGHRAGVASIAFAPSGKSLFSAGDVVKVWDIPADVLDAAKEKAVAPKTAIERGLRFVQEDAVKWRKEKECSTCHHGTMTVWALSEAKMQGYKIDAEYLADATKWTKERLFKNIDKPRDTRPGWSMLNTPALNLALMAYAVPKQESITADDLKRIAGHLLRHQEADGSWAWSSAPALNRPPPFFESDEVATLLGSMALGPHVPGDAKIKSPERDAFVKAEAWLAKNKPSDTTQAAALRLLRKVHAHETPQAELDDVLRLQNKDGGWSQVKDRPSDAYATGQTLYILSLAGLKKDRDEIRRGVAFLVATQKEDGSWPMTRRGHPGVTPGPFTMPIVYFGSVWGTMGLMRSVE